jgi:hypothetical protein
MLAPTEPDPSAGRQSRIMLTLVFLVALALAADDHVVTVSTPRRCRCPGCRGQRRCPDSERGEKGEPDALPTTIAQIGEPDFAQTECESQAAVSMWHLRTRSASLLSLPAFSAT